MSEPLFHSPGDDVVFLDRLVGLPCPKCQGDLVVASASGLKIVGCQQCRGLLLQKNVMAGLVRSRRAQHLSGDGVSQPFDQSELRQTSFCVACQAEMETHAYGGPGSVVIDSCAHCGLAWLDADELQRIVEAPGNRQCSAGDLAGLDGHMLDSDPQAWATFIAAFVRSN
ncbi:MAG: zf-TFIIB domain-containing protein [Pirellulaceae bacterium]